MPSQDYDINPQQTESSKSPNRINPALMPPIPNLPKAIVGSSGGNVAPQINTHPQNAQFSMEDIKRMIEVNYMMRNYEKESLTYPNNLLAPYYLTEYIKTKNVSVYTKNTLLSLGEYVKNSTNKQPRRKDIIDFLARTVVSHNNIFPDIPMDQKGIVSLISDVENFFSWTFENHYYDDVARNIYYDDVMARVTQISQQPANVAQQQANGQPVFNKNWINVYLKYIENKKTNAITKAYIKDSTKQTIKYIISTLIGCLTLSSGGSKQIQPTLSNILDIFIVYEKKMQYKTIQNYLHTYQELFRWTATEARKKGIYYPNIIGENVPGKRILENVIGKLRNLYNQNQIDQNCPTLKYFEKFEQACPKKDDGTNDDSLENFIEFLQYELHLKERPPQANTQPVTEAQQPIQNGILTPQDFMYYINSVGLSQQAKNILQSFGNYINRSSGKATRENVVEWIGHNVAYKNYFNPDNPMNDDQIQKVIDHIKSFFNWTEQKLTYNNIAHDIVVEEIKNRANMLLNDPLTIQEMKATRSKSSKQQPATANTPNLETNTTPPTIRPTIQPPKISPSDLKGLQENLKRLQPQNRENPIPKVNLGTHENFDLSSISQFTQLYDPLENLSNLSDIDRHTPLPDNNQIHEMNNNGIHQQVGNEPDPEGDSISFDYLYPEIGPDPFSPDYDLQYDDYY